MKVLYFYGLNVSIDVDFGQEFWSLFIAVPRNFKSTVPSLVVLSVGVRKMLLLELVVVSNSFLERVLFICLLLLLLLRHI